MHDDQDFLIFDEEDYFNKLYQNDDQDDIFASDNVKLQESKQASIDDNSNTIQEMAKDSKDTSAEFAAAQALDTESTQTSKIELSEKDEKQKSQFSSQNVQSSNIGLSDKITSPKKIKGQQK